MLLCVSQSSNEVDVFLPSDVVLLTELLAQGRLQCCEKSFKSQRPDRELRTDMITRRTLLGAPK